MTFDVSVVDFVVSILVQNGDTKTHLQSALVSRIHVRHSAADDQDSGPFVGQWDMVTVAVEDCGTHDWATLSTSSVCPS